MKELCYEYNQISDPTYDEEGFVKILRSEHDELASTVQRYQNLCQNLIRGGVDEATLDLLSSHSPDSNSGDVDVPFSQRTKVVSSGSGSLIRSAIRRPRSSESTAYSSDSEDEIEDSDSDTYHELPVFHKEPYKSPPQWTRPDRDRLPLSSPQFQRIATRTLQFSNIALGTTHTDVVAAVRGGQLVDLYLNNKDNNASVSFVLGHDARQFYDHVQKHGLRIKDVFVDVSWSERQFVLPGIVAGKLYSGASRNIVIRHCPRSISAATVCRDLDHIHNLFIVKIDFVSNDCYVGTNSIIAASFARTCLMSQFKYKHCRIEWAPDECAQPLDRMPQNLQQQAARTIPPPPKTGGMACANRFSLLDLDS